MDEKKFRQLYQDNRNKLAEAWNALTDKDLDDIAGNLGKFLKKITALYKVPEEIILKELDAVQKNIEEGIEADFAPRLDPTE